MVDTDRAWEDPWGTPPRGGIIEDKTDAWRTVSDKVESEAWFSAAAASRDLAAYLAGRLLNSLDWLAGRGKRHRKSDGHGLRHILGRLAEVSRLLEIPGEVPIHSAIEKVDREWRQWLNSPEYDRRCEDQADLGSNDKPFDTDWSEAIRKALHGGLSSRERMVVELGRCVDRAIRPIDRTIVELSEFFSTFEFRSALHDDIWEGSIRGLCGRIGLDLDLTSHNSLAVFPRVVAMDEFIRARLEAPLVQDRLLVNGDQQRGDKSSRQPTSKNGLARAKVGAWAHNTPPDAQEYSGGHMVGELHELAAYLNVDVKTLRTMNDKGRIWISSTHSKKWDLWFRSIQEYEDAWKRKKHIEEGKHS
jgi:hypothetical protein